MRNGNIDHIWQLLNTIPDPEIPVISIVELGVIRDITFSEKSYTILITPTYSGCPAVKAFTDDIKECLKGNGIRNFKLKLVYSPAWTTEWMSDETKNKLKKYGIAPPSSTIICPQCNSKNVKIISDFGATACLSLIHISEPTRPY